MDQIKLIKLCIESRIVVDFVIIL